MRNILPFAKRNMKEILRDPLSLVFGAAMPVILMIIFQIINNSTKNAGGGMDVIYSVDNLIVGISVFSFSFIALYGGLLISKDKDSSFLSRVFVSPMSSLEYILGYILPLLFLAVLQSIMCIASGFILDVIFKTNALSFGPEYLLLIIMLIPVALVMIAIGILLGSSLKYQAVGGIFSVLVQIVAFTSNIYFPIKLLGNGYLTVCKCLPFFPAVESLQCVLKGTSGVFPLYFIVLGYSVLITALAVFVFKKRMKE